MLEQHKRDKEEYDAIHDSTITKDKFYEPEPDFYDNNQLNF